MHIKKYSKLDNILKQISLMLLHGLLEEYLLFKKLIVQLNGVRQSVGNWGKRLGWIEFVEK